MMDIIKLERFGGKCQTCVHKNEQKAISSIVFQNSPCFDCVFNEDMPKMNRFVAVRTTVIPDEKKEQPMADILPFVKKEERTVNV